MASPPSFEDLESGGQPVFLRKVDKRAYWQPDLDSRTRSRQASEKIFKEDEEPFSHYRVTDTEELHRIIVGTNGQRGQLNGKSFYLAILGEDLAAAGIVPNHTPDQDNSHCLYVRERHWDFQADRNQVLRLCGLLFDRNCQITCFTPGTINLIIPGLRDLGCLAFPASDRCLSCGSRRA